ncbi:hypothetical protein LEP1GSC108_3964 [Leptospira weilii str. UI 13098]|uniref:Uncharacterized protein n=1 Tax=Leptospira weilii str. UI 13098 TaxID=1088542 RepID=M6Q3V7_9LEPT|nr:hypothetical protein LEP1GSC108_3964 [Leptospira weilii str. UI 13098]
MNSIEFSFLFSYLVYGETFFAWRRANRKLNLAPDGSRDNAPLLFGNLASYGALDSPN